MYYVIGVSVPSLHRESTDSLIMRRLFIFHTKLAVLTGAVHIHVHVHVVLCHVAVYTCSYTVYGHTWCIRYL